MNPPRAHVSRRDLFRLRSPATSGASPTSKDWPSLERLNGGDLLLARRPAMGSFFEVRLPAGTPGGAGLADAAMELIDALELQMTLYRDDSELCRLNASAYPDPVPVEPALFQLLQTAVRLGEQTDGAYDVASGALSLAWGFIKGPKRIPSPEELAEARQRSGRHLLRLDPEHTTLAFDRPGVVLNLGGIGKGYALDRVARVIRRYWFPTSALVHGGRSSLFAVGSPPDRFGGRWRIAVRNPFDPTGSIGTVQLRNRGLATSGPAYQSFEAGGRSYSHIIDPRIGEPLGADAPASVTVLAPSAAEADALSTAFSILGPTGSTAFLQRRTDVAAIFIERGPDDTEAPARLTLFNVSDHDFQPDPLVGAVGTA